MKRLLISLLAFMPSWLYAATDVPMCENSRSLFAIPCADKSMYYLGQIFGKVGDFIGYTHGVAWAEKSVLEQLFFYFNSTVLILGGILILYTLFVSTLKTAHEGEMLGRQWSSIWIPIRMAMGVAFLVPAGAQSGYSFIQIFMLWIITQGVGAADQLWSRALDSTRVISVAPTTSLSIVGAVQTTFQSLVCVNAYNKFASDDQDALSNNTRATITTTENGYRFDIPGKAGACGALSLAASSKLAKVQNAQKEAMATIITGLKPLAREFVREPNSSHDNAPLKNAINNYNTRMDELKKDAIEEAGNASQTKWIIQAKNRGWIMAGAYYHDISLASGELGRLIAPLTAADYQSSYFKDGVRKGIFGLDSNRNVPAFMSIMEKASSYSLNMDQSGNNSAAGSRVNSGNLGGDIGGKAMNKVGSAFNDILNNIMTAFSGQDKVSGKQINPLFAVYNFGSVILGAVQTIWLGVSAILIAVGVGFTIAAATPIVGGMGIAGATVALSVIEWLLGFLGPIMLFLFTSGATLAYYVPMIPYLIFTFGALGWG